MSAAQVAVPQSVHRKVLAVRRRRQALALMANAALALTALGGLVLAAMLVDWLLTPFDTSIRLLMTGAALFVGTALVVLLAARTYASRSSLTDVAADIDAAVPRLEERWSTVADLSQSVDPPEVRGSETLIRQVSREAEDLENLVEPSRLVSTRATRRGLAVLGAVAALFAIAWVADSRQATVLWQRFWSPLQEISLTQIESPTAGAVVPRHEPVTIDVRTVGRMREAATIWIRDEAGAVTEHAMTGGSGSFTFPIAAVDHPLEYRVRSGDGQTPWHSIQVADRPLLTGIEFEVVPPEYSRLPVVKEAGLPRRSRVLEGSTVSVSFVANEPLRELTLQLADGSALPVERTSECTFRFQQKVTEDLAFAPELINEHGLTNEQPPRCQIVVYRDQFPTVEIVSPDTDVVVRPDDEITVEFTARDDFGIARAELVITDAEHPESDPLKVIEIPLSEDQKGTDVRASTQLDLAQFDLKQGAGLSYAVRVFDTKDSVGESRPGSNSNENDDQLADATPAQQQPENAQSTDSQTNDAPSDQQPSNSAQSSSAPASDAPAKGESADGDPQTSETSPASETSPPTDPQVADRDQEAATNEAAQSKTQSSNPGTASPNADSRTAKAKPPSDDDTPAGRMEGAPRPGDSMARRQAPGGQCSSCRPMNLKVDEWAGSFAGQMRQKLELAIEDYLTRMDAALKQALDENQSVVDRLQAGETWGDAQLVSSRRISGHLTVASEVAVELAGVSAGTPYAFMGLQLAEIDERHVGAAQHILQGVGQLADGKHRPALETSQFHIRRARELLANLSKTYEGVKINQKLSDAMTHVKQMHQVFIEDTFQLLGSKRPVLNPKQRKFVELELDEEFRAKLKALLEKKRDVQAELAKVLAEHPDLLRRYMAQARLDADSLRDQMTLLARRQAELRDESKMALEATDEAGRAARLASMTARHEVEAVEIAEQAAAMFENFETWLPRGLTLEHEAVQPVHRLYEQLAADAGELLIPAEEGADPTAPARQLYDDLARLEAALPELVTAIPNNDGLVTHVTNRLAEVGKLTTLVSARVRKSEALGRDDSDEAAYIDQSTLTDASAELTNKIANYKASLAGMTPEIGALAETLIATLEDELLIEQVASEELLEARETAGAVEKQAQAVETFAQTEIQFDALQEAIIAYLDSLPVNTRPSLDEADVPSLEDLLAMLEQEKLAAEGLGIPCCRPSNLSVVRDWLSPSKGSSGMGGTMAGGMMSQSRMAQQRAQRLQQTADQRRQKLLAEAAAAAAKQPGARSGYVNPRWNTLQSRLDDSLKQVRGQSPPPKYRTAIERYFEVISRAESSRDE